MYNYTIYTTYNITTRKDVLQHTYLFKSQQTHTLHTITLRVIVYKSQVVKFRQLTYTKSRISQLTMSLHFEISQS